MTGAKGRQLRGLGSVHLAQFVDPTDLVGRGRLEPGSAEHSDRKAVSSSQAGDLWSCATCRLENAIH